MKENEDIFFFRHEKKFSDDLYLLKKTFYFIFFNRLEALSSVKDYKNLKLFTLPTSRDSHRDLMNSYLNKITKNNDSVLINIEKKSLNSILDMVNNSISALFLLLSSFIYKEVDYSTGIFKLIIRSRNDKFKKIFKNGYPKEYFALNSAWDYENSLTHYLKSKQIHTNTFQHAFFYHFKNHDINFDAINLINIPSDLVHVWSERDSEIIKNYFHGFVRIIGNPQLERVKIKSIEKNILICLPRKAYINASTKLIEIIRDCNFFEKFNFFVRMHPSIHSYSTKLQIHNNFTLDQSSSFSDCLSKIKPSVIIAFNSSIAFEAKYLGIETLIFSGSFDEIKYDDFITFSSGDEFKEILQKKL